MRLFASLIMSGGYSSDAQAVFARMNTPLSATYKNAINTFINSVQWSNVKEFWLFANDTQANSLIGWKGVRNADLVSATWSSSGITTNGSTSYISSNFIPSTDAVGQEDNLAVGALLKENLDTGNDRSLFGSVPTGGVGHIALGQYPSSAAIRVFANVNTLFDVSEGSNDDKIFDSETEYTAVQNAGLAYLYKDGLLINSASRANSGLSTVEILFGATLSNITPFRHLNAKFAAGYVIDPTGFDFREFHLALKTMLTTLGVYASTPELTIPTGGEWFDFSQASLGTLSSLVGRKSLLTATSADGPNIESHGGVVVASFDGTEYVDLGSTFQTFYDGTLPSSFSILITVKPTDGTSAQALFGHTNSTSEMRAEILSTGEIKITFKEPANAAISTTTTYPVFDDSPGWTILIFEFLKDEMIVEANGIKVLQTEDSWGSRALTDFVAGSQNMYLGAVNADGVASSGFTGYIGDFMIRRGAWSQSQKERLYNYFR